MHPKDKDTPAWKTYTQIADADRSTDRQMNRGNTICPFHHSMAGA